MNEKFWKRVDKSGECWVWIGPRHPTGYGEFYLSGVFWKTHRFAWAEENGPIPAGMFICHRCDNPPCVRPDHLFLGTPGDNARDRARKGRSNRRGEGNSSAKLTVEQVKAIRIARGTQFAIARQFGISQTQVSAIRRGEAWPHVPR